MLDNNLSSLKTPEWVVNIEKVDNRDFQFAYNIIEPVNEWSVTYITVMM